MTVETGHVMGRNNRILPARLLSFGKQRVVQSALQVDSTNSDAVLERIPFEVCRTMF